MTHPLVPQIIDLATPVAEELGLEVVGVVFHTNQRPPVLRVHIRNPQQDTGLDDCERMSRALEASLDAAEIVPRCLCLGSVQSWYFAATGHRQGVYFL